MFNFNSSVAWAWLIFGGWVIGGIFKPWPSFVAITVVGGFFLIAFLSRQALADLKEGDCVHMIQSKEGQAYTVPIKVLIIKLLPAGNVRVQILEEQFKPREVIVPITHLAKSY